VSERGVGLRASAVGLAKSIAKRAWAGYVGMPLLIVLGLAVLIVLNLAHRSLWGQLLYAVAITTAVIWGLGQLLCKHLEIPLISLQRSLLWAVFGVMAFPLAVAHGSTALIALFGFPLLWLAARVGRATINFPRETPPPWMGLVGGVLALTLFVVLTPRVASGESPPRASPIVTDEDQEQAALARQLRPVLLFDENEARFPLDIRAAVESRLIETCRAALGGEPCEFVEQDAEFDLGADYLNVADVKGPRGGGTNSAYYYRVVPRANRLYVDYWWYFTRNPTPVGEGLFCAPGFGLPGLTCHEHASDWEGVTVVLGPCKTFGPPCMAVGGKQWSPAAVRYAQHEFIVSYAWRPTLLRLWRIFRGRPTLRPLVYVANNSHASYPAACRQSCKQLRTLFGAPVSESAHDGRVPWARNDDCSTCLRRLPLTREDEPALWNAFDGRWGTQKCILAGAYCDSSRAPGAPAKQKRYRDPGLPGPWLCLRDPDNPASRALRRCTTQADSDAGIPGFRRSR
jgi:hypothetical protein